VCTVGVDNWQAQALAASYIFDGCRAREGGLSGRRPAPASGAARNASFHELLTRFPGHPARL